MKNSTHLKLGSDGEYYIATPGELVDKFDFITLDGELVFVSHVERDCSGIFVDIGAISDISYQYYDGNMICRYHSYARERRYLMDYELLELTDLKIKKLVTLSEIMVKYDQSNEKEESIR